MGIELGSIGSAVGNMASGVGRGAASVGRIEGSLPGFAKLEGFGQSIVNEGPVGLADLTNTMPLTLGQVNPVQEIAFNNPVGGAPSLEPLSVASVMTEAESILSQALRVDPVQEIMPISSSVIPAEAGIYTNNYLWIPHQVRDDKKVEFQIFPKIEPVALPLSAPQILEQPKTELRAAVSPARNASASVAGGPALTPAINTEEIQPTVLTQLQPVEQEVEEEVAEKKEKRKPAEALEEGIEIENVLYLEDENALAQRKVEVREAVAKAKVEASRLGLKGVAGWLVAKFLPGEHEGNRSEVVKKTGPDGSYQETVEAIAGAGEFRSGEKAVEKFDGIVAEKKPVKVGKNGTPVGRRALVRVFKYRLIKPIEAHAEVIKRVIKKKVLVTQTPSPTPAVVSEKKEIKAEPNLQELNPALAEVFAKAA